MQAEMLNLNDRRKYNLSTTAVEDICHCWDCCVFVAQVLAESEQKESS